jgi:hypothetical protein
MRKADAEGDVEGRFAVSSAKTRFQLCEYERMHRPGLVDYDRGAGEIVLRDPIAELVR